MILHLFTIPIALFSICLSPSEPHPWSILSLVIFEIMSRNEVVFKNGDRYEGELENQQPHGKGKYLFQDGSKFTGEFALGLFHGHGHLLDTFSEISIQGHFKEGQAHGHCKVSYPDGSTYQGNMEGGYRQGNGTLNFGPSSPFKTYKGNFS